MQTTKPHAALLASPGMGHLIPVIELGKRLVTHHNLQVTVFVVANNTCTAKLSQLINSSSIQDFLDVIELPFVDISPIVPPDASFTTQMAIMMHESLPALRSSISAMKFRPTALIVDMFGLEAMSVVADEFEMFKYVFIASNAWFLALVIYAPALDKKTTIDEHINKKKPLKIPGCSSVRFEDTLEPFQDQSDPLFDGFLKLGIHMSDSDGILVNTWEDLEPKTLATLRDTHKFPRAAKAPPVYPIGPLAKPVASTVSESKVLDWLDKQPNESVIYVSFGSGGTLSSKQTTELACGLELSKQRFIWVVRPPLDQDLLNSYLTGGNDVVAGNNLDYLPEGFLSRTDNVGLVVPTWAPQKEILAHPSVGGILTHCGWNSTLESLVNGVPMIAWPLFAEQKMNATMLTEEIGVAVRSKEMPSECIVERDEIGMLVRRILVDQEGLVVRNKVKELKYRAQKATSEGGCSYYSLSKFARDFENSLQRFKAKARGA